MFLLISEREVVAFTVMDYETLTYSRGDRILFADIKTNEGAGWKGQEHEFVCPYSGYYSDIFDK